jgi:hypothetical protein
MKKLKIIFEKYKQWGWVGLIVVLLPILPMYFIFLFQTNPKFISIKDAGTLWEILMMPLSFLFASLPLFSKLGKWR